MTSAAAESGLNRSVDFMAERYLALVAKLAERDATLERVRDALLMGGQSADIRWRAALRALDGAE